jgi:hypothetical protein
MGTIKQARQKRARLQGRELPRALEALRDTKSQRRAEELKKLMSDSICGENEEQTTNGQRLMTEA